MRGGPPLGTVDEETSDEEAQKKRPPRKLDGKRPGKTDKCIYERRHGKRRGRAGPREKGGGWRFAVRGETGGKTTYINNMMDGGRGLSTIPNRRRNAQECREIAVG